MFVFLSCTVYILTIYYNIAGVWKEYIFGFSESGGKLQPAINTRWKSREGRAPRLVYSIAQQPNYIDEQASIYSFLQLLYGT